MTEADCSRAARAWRDLPADRVVWRPLCLGLLLLAGCSGLPRGGRVELPVLRLLPTALAGEFSLVQQLHFERVLPAGEIVAVASLDVLLEGDSRSLRLAGLSNGRRLLRLEWDGHVLGVEQAPEWSAGPDITRILRDLQLVYWPAEHIRDALPAGWVLEEARGQRQLRRGSQEVWTLRFDGGSPASSVRLTVQNLAESYRLRIANLPGAP